MFRKRRKSLSSCWNWLEFLLWTVCLLNISHLAQIVSSLVHQEFSCCINFLHHLDYYCKFNESFHWCIGKLSGQWDLREQKESCFCPTIAWFKNVTSFLFPSFTLVFSKYSSGVATMLNKVFQFQNKNIGLVHQFFPYIN